MKRVKLIWLAAVAAFALTAVAVTAGSASAAEPEWGHCVPVKSKGHYEDGNCTKEDFKENKKHETQIQRQVRMGRDCGGRLLRPEKRPL